jgi:hypothetical protein
VVYPGLASIHTRCEAMSAFREVKARFQPPAGQSGTPLGERGNAH